MAPDQDAVIAPLERSTTIRWGTPLAAKPPRVVLVLPRIAERDAMELALRLDMMYETVLLDPAEDGSNPDDRLKNLQVALDRQLDLLVLANIDFASLPDGIFERIRNQVHNGAGLLLANHQHTPTQALQDFLREVAPVESTSPITRGIAPELTPEWHGGLDFVQAATYGNGRVVQLNYPGAGPAYHALLPELLYPEQAEWAHYETYWSLIAKAALWAARREPSQWIDRIQEEAPQEKGYEELPPGMTEDEMREYVAATDTRLLHAYRLHLNAPAEETYDIIAQLRQPGRQWRTRILQSGDPLRSGDESFALAVPAIPGLFYLDTWLRHRGQTVDWHSVPTTIRARPFFRNLRTPREVVLANDTIRATFELLPSQHTEDELRRCVVALRATDAYGRRVGFSTGDAPGPRRTFTARLDVADLISNRLTLECMVFSQSLRSTQTDELHLVNAGGCKLPLGVRLPGPVHPFGLAVANHTSQEYTLRALNALLADAGLTSIVTPAREDAARFVPDEGLTPVFQLTGHWRARNIESLAAEGVIPQGAPPPACLDQLTQDVRRVRVGAAAALLLGGSNSLETTRVAIQTSPAVVQEFRARLWAEFDAPAALGPEWASRFKTWDDLSAETIRQAADDGFFEPWMRFQQHVDAVFLRLYNLARTAIRQAEPVAPIGFSMTASPTGISPLWYGTAAGLEFIAAPPDPVSLARATAYRAPDAQTVLCALGAATDAEAGWWPWHTVLNRCSGLWWNLDAGPESVMAGPVSIDPLFAEVLAQTKTVKSGFADLFLASQPAPASIAVYDSRPSELLQAARKNPPRQSLATALAILETLGFAVDPISSASASSDRFNDYKCLILPDVLVLSDAEVNRIRAFVRGGGLVLADAPPGAYDEFGRPRKDLPLGDLFRPFLPRETTPGDDQTPPRNPRAYLLDHSFSEDLDQESLTLLESLVREALCEKVLEVSGDEPFDGQRFCFTFDKARVYAALTRPDQPGPAKYRLAIPADGHVYDMKTGLEVRKPERIGWRAAPGEVALFSTLPYRVIAVEAVVPDTVRPGNRINLAVQILTEGRPPGKHLVLIQLRPLGGAPIPYYDKTFVCDEGRGTAFIPLALDEPQGFYKVVVRDMLTGTESEWPVEVASALRDSVTININPES